MCAICDSSLFDICMRMLGVNKFVCLCTIVQYMFLCIVWLIHSILIIVAQQSCYVLRYFGMNGPKKTLNSYMPENGEYNLHSLTVWFVIVG